MRKCDICYKEINEWVDGRTISGPWANMCMKCYQVLGMGLGTGLGQH